MAIVWAITEANCPEARGKVCGQYTVVPPGTRMQRHYHKGCDAVICFIKGRFKMIMGERGDELPVAVHTFAYIPRGEIHAYANMDPTEEAEEIAYYIGVSSKEASETVFIEDKNFREITNALEDWRKWRNRLSPMTLAAT
jgi:uncharacterized RmlC-like cupin family protein